jgi:hypothetical protein
MTQCMILAVFLCFFVVDGASANSGGQAVEPTLSQLPVCLIDNPAVPPDISGRLVAALKGATVFSLVETAENAALILRITPDAENGGWVASAEAGPAACLPWEQLKAPVAGDGLQIFVQNMRLAQRMQGLYALSRAADSSVKTQLAFYRSGVKLENGKPVQEGLVLIEGRIWHREREQLVEGFTVVTDEPGQAVVLSATNTGTAGAYVYGVNFTRSGKIILFTSTTDNGPQAVAEAGFVAPGAEVEFDAGVVILEEESEGLLVLKSDTPLDLSALAATGFYTAFSAGGTLLRDDGKGTW